MKPFKSQHSWIVLLTAIVLLSGCGTTQYTKVSETKPVEPGSLVLSEGDVVKVAFPSASNLDTTAQIRRDGKITLPVIGEVQASGLTASELEKTLKTKYQGQLVSNEINVLITSSLFCVYVTGVIAHPGKVCSDRPMTALDALMEAGGPDYSRANLKAVLVDRKINGHMVHYKLDLQRVLRGQSNETFNLRPGDILYIPERFSWF